MKAKLYGTHKPTYSEINSSFQNKLYWTYIIQISRLIASGATHGSWDRIIQSIFVGHEDQLLVPATRTRSTTRILDLGRSSHA